MYKLLVTYKNKNTDECYKREYPYSGITDKSDWKWLKDADAVAFGNCQSNEDVMGYKLVEIER